MEHNSNLAQPAEPIDQPMEERNGDASEATTVTYSELDRGIVGTMTGAEYALNRNWGQTYVPDNPTDQEKYVTFGTVIRGKVKTPKTKGRGDDKVHLTDEKGVPLYVNKTMATPLKVLFSQDELNEFFTENGAILAAGHMVMPLYAAAYKAGNPIPANYTITVYDLMRYYNLDTSVDVLTFLLTKAYAPTSSKVNISANIAASCDISMDFEPADLYSFYAKKFSSLDAKSFGSIAKKSDWTALSKFLGRNCTPRGKTWARTSVIELGITIFGMELEKAEQYVMVAENDSLASNDEDARNEYSQSILQYNSKASEYRFILCALEASLSAARKEEQAKLQKAKGALMSTATDDIPNEVSDLF